MSIYVNTNVQSIFAQRALGKNTFNLQKSIEKLSTGFKINRAGDDAAGLSISEKLTAQVRGLETAKQNVGDGISAIQTAEGGLAIVQDNLQRIRELVVQASNGTNGLNEENAIQREINERITTIQSIAKETSFNGNALLLNTSNISLQTGADNSQTTTLSLVDNTTANSGIQIDIDEATSSTASDMYGGLLEGITHVIANDGTDVPVFQLSTLKITRSDADAVASEDFAAAAIAQTSLTAGNEGLQGKTLTPIDKLDTILNNVSRMRSYLGAMQNSLESKAEYLDVAVENNSASRSRIRDVDVAQESSVMLRNQILQQSAASMLTQANATPQLALNLLP